jgi:hypothetical protein
MLLESEQTPTVTKFVKEVLSIRTDNIYLYRGLLITHNFYTDFCPYISFSTILDHRTLTKYKPGNYCKYLDLNKMKLQEIKQSPLTKMARHSINFYSPRKERRLFFKHQSFT